MALKYPGDIVNIMDDFFKKCQLLGPLVFAALAASGAFLLKFGFFEYQFAFGLIFAAAVVLMASAQIGMSVKTSVKLGRSRTYIRSMMLTAFLGYFSTCLMLCYGVHVIGTGVLDYFWIASFFMYAAVSFMLWVSFRPYCEAAWSVRD
jgi:hypothetical protein